MITHIIATEYFQSAQELLKEDDRIESDIKVEGWSKPLRVRALSLAAREKINQESGVGEKRDWSKYIVHTFIHGIVRPHFTTANTDEILDHNADTLDEVAEFIWQMGRLNKNIFDEYIKSLKDLEEARKNEDSTKS